MTWIIYALLFALEYAQYIMFFGLIFNGIVWIIIIICNILYVWRVIFIWYDFRWHGGDAAAGQQFLLFFYSQTDTHCTHDSIYGIRNMFYGGADITSVLYMKKREFFSGW